MQLFPIVGLTVSGCILTFLKILLRGKIILQSTLSWKLWPPTEHISNSTIISLWRIPLISVRHIPAVSNFWSVDYLHQWTSTWVPNHTQKSDKWLDTNLYSIITQYFNVGCWGLYSAINNWPGLDCCPFIVLGICFEWVSNVSLNGIECWTNSDTMLWNWSHLNIYFYHKYLHLSQSKLIFLTKPLIMNAFYRRCLHIFLTLECISALVGQWTSLVWLHLVSNYTCTCMLWGLYTRRLTNCVYYVCR